MSEHGATLQNQFQRLASVVENLKSRKFNIQKMIQVQEEKKMKIVKEIEEAQLQVGEVENTLETLKTAQSNLDETIAKAEEAFEKIEQNAGLLLVMTNRTERELDKVLQDLNK